MGLGEGASVCGVRVGVAGVCGCWGVASVPQRCKRQPACSVLSYCLTTVGTKELQCLENVVCVTEGVPGSAG